MIAASLIENVRFCPASAWFASRVIVEAVTLIAFTELSEPSMVLRTGDLCETTGVRFEGKAVRFTTWTNEALYNP